MDKRQRLARGSVLSFPGMECHVEELLGAGSNAMVYTGWYQDHVHEQERHRVLIKELFPYAPDGSIRRLADGSIHAEEGEALAFFLMHRESFEAGNRIHLRLLESCPDAMGANLNTFEHSGTLYTILGYSGGRTLEEEFVRLQDAGIKRSTQLMLSLLDALSAFHDSGYLHLDISPDNALLIGRSGNERMMLIDYNSAREIGDLTPAYLSFKEGYSAPELFDEMGDPESVCEASDLYSVAAIFYRLLMGRALTLEETLMCVPPGASDSPLLAHAPQTVVSHVNSILRKGLRTLAEDRYQSIDEMRTDFLELLDRINCVGVTHWALWESGRRSIEELIRENPSLRYVTDEENMYPIRIEQDDRCMGFDEFIDEILSQRGRSRLTLSPGGMGKTTLLMKAALAHGQTFSPYRPAMFYISLSGWNGGDTRYIRSRLLASLRFKKENNTYDSAFHELEQLLGRTICCGQAERPMLLLLLDGLNEVRGDAAPLMQEINLLSKMAGVTILAASRSEISALELETNRILSLTHEDVQRAASAKGVLLPRSEALEQLIRTPLILSIYLTACENGQLLHIRDQDDLMGAYMASLYQKEIRDLPENSPQRWQADAALGYVLPAIAAEMAKAGGRLTDAQMLCVVEQCYKVLSSGLLVKAFPQWIGRSRDILDGAKSAEAWFGLMVHDLLWKRLGLLMKDGQGGCSVFHQTIAEYLAQRHKENAAAIRRKQMIKSAALCMAALLVCAAAAVIYATQFMIVPYDEDQAENALVQTRKAYDWYMDIYEEMNALLALAQPQDMARQESKAEFAGWITLAPRQNRLQRSEARLLRTLSPFEYQYDQAQGVIKGWGRTDDGIYDRYSSSKYPSLKESRETALAVYRMALEERRIVPWSNMALDAEGLMAIYSHLWDRQTYYAEVFLPEFKKWYNGSQGDFSESYMLCLDTAQSMLDYDAQVCQELYNLYLSVHMAGNEGLVALEVDADDNHKEETLARVRQGVKAYGEADSAKLLETVKGEALRAEGGWNTLMQMFFITPQRTDLIPAEQRFEALLDESSEEISREEMLENLKQEIASLRLEQEEASLSRDEEEKEQQEQQEQQELSEAMKRIEDELELQKRELDRYYDELISGLGEDVLQ